MDTFIPTFDAAAIGVTLFAHTIYLICYQTLTLQESNHTQKGRNFGNMLLWVDKHNVKSDAPNVTLAIQTLRNTILVAIFVGGSSLAAAIGACDILTRPEVTPQIVCRQLLIGSQLFLSFLNWAQVIRFCNHMGYYVGTLETHIKNKMEERKSRMAALAQQQAVALSSNVSRSIDSHETSPAVDSYIDVSNTVVLEEEDENDTAARIECNAMGHKITAHFSWGFRFIYFAIPFWMYSGGPVALIAAAGVNIVLLCLFDFPRRGSTGTSTKEEE